MKGRLTVVVALVLAQHGLALWLAARDSASVVLATGLWGHWADLLGLGALMVLRVLALLVAPGWLLAGALKALLEEPPRDRWRPTGAATRRAGG